MPKDWASFKAAFQDDLGKAQAYLEISSVCVNKAEEIQALLDKTDWDFERAEAPEVEAIRETFEPIPTLLQGLEVGLFDAPSESIEGVRGLEPLVRALHSRLLVQVEKNKRELIIELTGGDTGHSKAHLSTSAGTTGTQRSHGVSSDPLCLEHPLFMRARALRDALDEKPWDMEEHVNLTVVEAVMKRFKPIRDALASFESFNQDAAQTQTFLADRTELMEELMESFLRAIKPEPVKVLDTLKVPTLNKAPPTSSGTAAPTDLDTSTGYTGDVEDVVGLIKAIDRRLDPLEEQLVGEDWRRDRVDLGAVKELKSKLKEYRAACARFKKAPSKKDEDTIRWYEEQVAPLVREAAVLHRRNRAFGGTDVLAEAKRLEALLDRSWSEARQSEATALRERYKPVRALVAKAALQHDGSGSDTSGLDALEPHSALIAELWWEASRLAARDDGRAPPDPAEDIAALIEDLQAAHRRVTALPGRVARERAVIALFGYADYQKDNPTVTDKDRAALVRKRYDELWVFKRSCEEAQGKYQRAPSGANFAALAALTARVRSNTDLLRKLAKLLGR